MGTEIWKPIVGEKLKIINGKPVCQFNKNGEIINTFCSAKEACRKTGINNSSISECCLGKRRTAGGFVWRYKNAI